MKRLRHDADHLISALLLVVAVATVLTGVIAHLWDLNDFWWHTYAGYAMAAVALLHVLFNWGRLTAYARFRLRRRTPGRPSAPRAAARPAPPRAAPEVARDLLLSRRALVGATVGGLTGWALGRGLRPPPVIPQGADVGVVYHEWSKPGVVDALGTLTTWGDQPPLYKSYPDAPRVDLPAPDLGAGLATEEAIRTRRSTRAYGGAPLTLAELSRVLLLTGGISAGAGTRARRTAPSSGALYPVEIYPVVHRVDGLEPGVYHYDVAGHALERLRSGDVRDRVVRQGLVQTFLGEADVVLLLTVIFQRMRFKYQDRTYRYGLLEAGHLGQNVYLAATSMGLGACAVGAFLDDDVNAMLGVDGREEAAVSMLTLGRPA
jgi:SagB-type dehydrogenase family enzyme